MTTRFNSSLISWSWCLDDHQRPFIVPPLSNLASFLFLFFFFSSQSCLISFDLVWNSKLSLWKRSLVIFFGSGFCQGRNKHNTNLFFFFQGSKSRASSLSSKLSPTDHLHLLSNSFHDDPTTFSFREDEGFSF